MAYNPGQTDTAALGQPAHAGAIPAHIMWGIARHAHDPVTLTLPPTPRTQSFPGAPIRLFPPMYFTPSCPTLQPPLTSDTPGRHCQFTPNFQARRPRMPHAQVRLQQLPTPLSSYHRASSWAAAAAKMTPASKRHQLTSQPPCSTGAPITCCTDRAWNCLSSDVLPPFPLTMQ